MTFTARNSALTIGLAATAALVAIGVPLAIAAPTAAPPSDSQGYVDSTARCAKPDTAVIFGTTDSSRIAVCQTAAGGYEYRGVRVRDGAKLIVPATGTADNTFVAKYEAATYTVTPQVLSVTVNGNTVRTETWTDYHGPQSAGSSKASTSAPTTSATTTSATTPATTSATGTSTAATAAPSTSGSAAATTSSAPKTSTAPSTSGAPSTPLPAEVGGASSAAR